MKKPENKVLADDYTSRINRVIDFIENNIEKSLTLDELATISHFSKFHFSRIFWAMTGETPFEFIARVRLEKAASLLRYNQHEPVMQVALKCGFTDISVFSRNFKAFFKSPPSSWRTMNLQDSNNSQQLSNCSQPNPGADGYFCEESKTKKRRFIMEFIQDPAVEIKNLPATTIAYVRHTGPYQGDGALFERLFAKLFSWAGPRGLLAQKDQKSMAIYHDDPCVTEADKLRLSICLPVPPDTKTDGEIGKMVLDGGKYAVAHFELLPPEFPSAWQWLLGTWFPASGYQPDDKLCFEQYTGQPKNGRITVDICVPVKPL
jgi:AraC family transcriptional regulator